MTQNEITYYPDGNAASFTGPKAIEVFRLAALSVALNAYAKHKMQMNRMLTPTRMLKLANEATGCKFTRSNYAMAAEAVKAKVTQLKAEIEQEKLEEQKALAAKLGLVVEVGPPLAGR